MRHYRATNAETSNVVEYDAESPQAEHLGDGWTLEDCVVPGVPQDPPVPPPYQGSWHITRLAFDNRFQAAELVRIEMASLDNPALAIDNPMRILAAGLRSNQRKVDRAQYIDLKREDTRAGVVALEAYGLISAGRSEQILDVPPAAEELYRG